MITDPRKIHRLLDRHILANVEEPGQYVDREVNSVHKEHGEVDVRMALCFPDRYRLGMSHVGFKILYGIINDLDWALAERAYAPWADMQEKMREYDIPLYGLESYRPLREFDCLGFTLQSELLYTNVLMMLEMAQLPVESSQRADDAPLIIAGGPGAGYPEPMAEFIDVFLVGDGEETVVELAELLRQQTRGQLGREQLMLETARSIDGAYVPAFYQPEYDNRGFYAGLRPLREDVPEQIEPARVEDLDAAPYPTAPVVPTVRTVHDQITLEIMRGCGRGCRFCHAGMTNRPVRHRSPEKLLELAKQSYDRTGHNEIGLTSLSSSDYPHMAELLELLTAHFDRLNVNVALPSLRVSDQLDYLVGPLSSVRKSSLTLAPEAGTDRLRRVIKKDITTDELLDGASAAVEAGWKRMKLYFMVGLPTETEKDVRAVGDLCKRALKYSAPEGQRSPLKLNVTISPFVPKPHTPFQWEPMEPPDSLQEKIYLIRDTGRHRKVNYKFHDPRRSVIESALCRGDRRIGKIIRQVWREGGQFDGWDDCFDADLWERALSENGVELAGDADSSPNSPFRRRKRNESLPWDHIREGPDKSVLKKQLRRAEDEAQSPVRKNHQEGTP